VTLLVCIKELLVFGALTNEKAAFGIYTRKETPLLVIGLYWLGHTLLRSLDISSCKVHNSYTDFLIARCETHTHNTCMLHCSTHT